MLDFLAWVIYYLTKQTQRRNEKTARGWTRTVPCRFQPLHAARLFPVGIPGPGRLQPLFYRIADALRYSATTAASHRHCLPRLVTDGH